MLESRELHFLHILYTHLTGSHMMIIALACRDAGLCFAGVHDSFWTHACDVNQMNEILWEKFVELYSMLILENVSELRPVSLPEIGSPHKFRSFSGLFQSKLGGMTCI